MFKKLLFSLFLCVSFFSSKAQQGYINLNDFNIITNGWWPYQESVFWLRNTPIGTVRVISFRGTWQTRIHTDSLVIPQLSLVDSANPYKLLWIGEDSVVRAFVPTYLDASDTTGKWLPVGTVLFSGDYNDLTNKPDLDIYLEKDDTISLSNRINTKLNISDTTNKWLPIGTVLPGHIQSDWDQTDSAEPDFIKNKPELLRIETFLGTTDGSGNYTVTYSTPYASVPDVQPQLQSGTPSQVVRITSSTTTGFTVQVTNRASVNLLGFEILLAATTPVSGSSVSVLVTSR